MRWIWDRFRVIAAVVLVGGLAFAAWSQREAIASFDWNVDRGALLGAVALFAVAPLLQGLTLALALRRLGVRPPAADGLRIWARSWLLRYEPSGAVGFALRVRERERLGATSAQVLTATGYEQFAVVLSGAIVAVAAFVVAGLDPPLLAWILLGTSVVLAVALRPSLGGGELQRRLAARGIQTAGLLPGRTLALLVGVDIAGWIATGAAAVLLATTLQGSAAPDPLVLLGAFALSWLLGVLIPLMPGGLGPRDAALVALLSPVAGFGPAAALALALRLVSLAGEVLAAGIAEGAALLARTPAPAPSLPAEASAPTPPTARARDTIVVVPTFDEAEALPLFVERFAAAGMDLLIVDDASPDGTGDIAERLAHERPWMHVLHRAGKQGLGTAYRDGFRWCLERDYAIVGQMDCDLSHPPERLADLRAALDERQADLVIGSRYLRGGGTEGWSRTRLALSRIGCTASRLALGLPFSDLSGGFKLWRSQTLRDLDLDGCLSTGYAFQVETTQLAYLMGKRIEEVPFVFSERVAGESKMTLAISLEGIRVTLALRRRARGRTHRGHGFLAA